MKCGKREEKSQPNGIENDIESDSDSSIYSELSDDEESSSNEEEQDDGSDDSGDDQEEELYAEVDDTSKKVDVSSNAESSSAAVPDEYEYDSSDEEDLRNTVGNIPMNWYDDYQHIGYDLSGEKIMKPTGDNEIDDFLNKIDDPNYWRTVKDKMTGERVVLDDETVDFIQRIQRGKYPTNANIYEPFEDFFTYETMKFPLSSRPEHKRSFIPSLVEKQKVGRLVHAIKMGWIKPRAPKEDKMKFYMLWNKDVATVSKRMQHYIAPPKMKLPGHEESYNPPPEYLFTKEEEERWKNQEPEERKLDFIPQKYSCLRLVPSYPNFMKERFERCLDLYLCPRQRKMRVNVDPNDLIPKLPKPRDLQPFPTVLSVVYSGHTDMVRSISVEPAGQFLASGSDDKTLKIWEVLTGRCLRTFQLDGIIHNIAWCPNEAICLLLVAVGDKVYIINPSVGDKLIKSNTDMLIKSLSIEPSEKAIQWLPCDDKQWLSGIRMIVKHPKEVRKLCWHNKGDYFASYMPDAGNRQVVIHRLSKAQSQFPFQKLKGRVQCIQFHPLRPLFFIALEKHVKVYDLLKQELVKKLLTNCKWVSSMAVHPQGDNIIVGSYDCRLSWFDLELSTKPYKTLRHHKKAIRQVAFHKRYPLFASASDDGTVIVCHGMVYADLLQNACIVPVKILKGHATTNLSVLDCCFHPLQPWIFSSGADGTVRLYS